MQLDLLIASPSFRVRSTSVSGEGSCQDITFSFSGVRRLVSHHSQSTWQPDSSTAERKRFILVTRMHLTICRPDLFVGLRDALGQRQNPTGLERVLFSVKKGAKVYCASPMTSLEVWQTLERLSKTGDLTSLLSTR